MRLILRRQTRTKRSPQSDQIFLHWTTIGFDVELLDLTSFFKTPEMLENKLSQLNGVWVSGGNTFVLRQAMKLSKFDEIIHSTLVHRHDFLYGGYSAGCCVLSSTLDHLQIVDKPDDFPYPNISETIWEGLDIIDFAFLPHYDSDHHESKLIDQEIKYCIDNKIIFLALRDGEVIIEDSPNDD